MPTAAENKKTVSDAYAAISSGDPKGFLGALAPDVEVHEPACLPHGGTYRGAGELVRMFGKAAAVLRPGAMELLEVVADEERAVALLRLGLRNGADVLVSEHWTLVDGKCTELRVFWDDPTVAVAAAGAAA